MSFLKLLIFTMLLKVKPIQNSVNIGTQKNSAQQLLREHMTECVLKISLRFFHTPPYSTAYSLSLSDKVHQKVSFTSINRVAIPKLMNQNPVEVSNSMKDLVRLDLAVRRPGNYIIEVPFIADFPDSLKTLKSSPSWNPHARVLVLITLISNNSSTRLVSKIMKDLWNAKVKNGIVLQPNSSTTFNLYSWFPYRDGNCGQNFHKLEFLDHCDADGNFQSNSSLFINKIPSKFNKCPIKVIKIDIPPYVINVENGTTGTRKDYLVDRGLEIDILDYIAERYNLVMWYFNSARPGNWGQAYENGTVTGNLYHVQQETYDIAVGSYSKNYIKSVLFDETSSYHQESLHYCVPRFPDEANIPSLTGGISTEIWFLIVLVILSTAVINFFIAKLNRKKPVPYGYLMTCILNYYAFFLGVPVYNMPRTFGKRFIIAQIILLSYFVISAYQTVLVSSLTRRDNEEKIQTVQDIFDNNLETYYPGSVFQFFKNYGENENIRKLIRDNWRVCENMDECTKRMITKRDISLTMLRFHAEYELKKYFNHGIEPMVYCFETPVISYPVGMLMRKGFPLFNRFNLLIQTIRESGLVAKWGREFAKSHFFTSQTQGGNEQADLKFSAFVPAFKMLLIGEGIAFIAFITELIYQ